MWKNFYTAGKTSSALSSNTCFLLTVRKVVPFQQMAENIHFYPCPIFDENNY